MVTFVGGVNPVTESMMQWMNNLIEERRFAYELCRRYYDGNHDTAVTDRLRKFLPPRMDFRDNFMDVVVDSLAERLKVIGFDTTNAPIAEWAWDLWRQNRMDNMQGIVHAEAIALGDSYILCDWDEANGRPRWTHQKPEMILPHYNEVSRQIDWVSKKWMQEPEIRGEPETRLNIYYPDRVEKFLAKNGVWRRFQDELDDGWPVPWVDSNGEAIGIPFIHFRNKPMGEDFGLSEIWNVLPMQDLLNKSLIDLSMIQDTSAFPQRYTLNINHGSSRIDIMPGSIAEFHSEYDGGQIGQWPTADISGLLQSIETLVQHIAGTTRTPQHLFQLTGGIPSGEALKTAESGLVKKAEQRMVTFGNAWEDCLAMALRIQGAFSGGISVEPDMMIETTWDDPETRNEQALLQTLQTKSNLGVPQDQILREMGYNQDQIDQMNMDRVRARQQQTNIGSEILRSFTAGEVE